MTIINNIADAYNKFSDSLNPDKYALLLVGGTANIAYLFEIINNESIDFQSDITDNYVENNTAIQDQIAIKPLTISLSGLVGELSFTPPMSALNFLFENIGVDKIDNFTSSKINTTVTDKLSTMKALLPPVSNATQLAKNAIQYAESSVRRYLKYLDGYANKYLLKKPTEYKQHFITRKLKDIWESRTPCRVLTSRFGVYDNMYIQSINLTQGETLTTSTLSITLKQVRFADVTVTEADKTVLAKYTNYQTATEQNNGKAQGVKTNSAMYDLLTPGVSYKNR